ncbi:MAG TPA: hypothetical protein VFB96_15040 [Pirellulaceae bacterium]|nr:hypothetical protein [Pirellulaceae bacterium]
MALKNSSVGMLFGAGVDAWPDADIRRASRPAASEKTILPSSA